MKLLEDFEDYELLDTSDGMKLERWGQFTFLRPDPQIIWKNKSKPELWDKVDAIYSRSNTGGGTWNIKKNIPSTFEIRWKDLTFNLKLMSFKHTGLFPEQSYNWNIIRKKIKESNRSIKVLNLFAYTGAASVAALSSNASVVHVDSSRGMLQLAKENVRSSNLEDKPIRFILDDVKKFVLREIRRNNKYDMIIMDPPSFGRGNKKEVWNIENDLYDLVDNCTKLLSDDPIMFLINSYTTGLSMSVLENILKMTVNKKYPGVIYCDELGIRVKDEDIILPCGIFARWERR